MEIHWSQSLQREKALNMWTFPKGSKSERGSSLQNPMFSLESFLRSIALCWFHPVTDSGYYISAVSNYYRCNNTVGFFFSDLLWVTSACFYLLVNTESYWAHSELRQLFDFKWPKVRGMWRFTQFTTCFDSWMLMVRFSPKIYEIEFKWNWLFFLLPKTEPLISFR